MTKPPNPPVNTTASWRVELHLHFLIFYFLRNRTNENKNTDSFEDREKQRLTWLLIFNFPLVFFFFVVFIFLMLLLFFFDCLHSGGRKEKPSQPISLPGLKKKKTTHLLLSVWTLNPVLSHVSHVKAYQVLVRIEARRRAQQEEPTCSLYWRTYTHKHIHTAHTQIHNSF